MTDQKRVLVVGGTGHLGRQVVRAARSRGYEVRAMVRPGSSSEAVEQEGASVVRGDMLDPSSLDASVEGCDAVISTAIGYSNRKKGDADKGIDTEGYRNLIDATARAGAGRFVLCSILTCDQAPDVPHFQNKKLTEDYLREKGLSFVSLRPGAFIDQGPGDWWANGLRKGKLPMFGNPETSWSYIHTHDLARFLAEAVDIELDEPGATIDIACDRPVSPKELVQIFSEILGREIRLQSVPWAVASTLLTVSGLFDPWQRDFKAMMKYILSGNYVADLTSQTRYFGQVPTIEDSLRRYASQLA